jgi:hypothetical protein
MMGANAEFLRGAADAQRQNAAEAAGPDGTDQADQMARFIRNARLIGVESIDGRNAYHLQAKDLGPAQQIDGGEYKMDTMSIWFDTEHYVSLRMKMDGTLTSEGETRPMTIENIQTDYRVVPGSNGARATDGKYAGQPAPDDGTNDGSATRNDPQYGVRWRLPDGNSHERNHGQSTDDRAGREKLSKCSDE